MRPIKLFALVGALVCIGSPCRANIPWNLYSNVGESGLDGEKLFLDAGSGTTGSGNVGSQFSGVIVNMASNVSVDYANGWSNIKPSSKDDLFTSLTFTPVDKMGFTNFSFRGQLKKEGDIVVEVKDTAGGDYTFAGIHEKANQDFNRIELIANGIPSDPTTYMGPWIDSVTISVTEGFKEVKQIAFSTAIQEGGGPPNPPAPTPEPSTLAIAGLGALGFLGCGLRRRMAK
jgi:hypothetical protein